MERKKDLDRDVRESGRGSGGPMLPANKEFMALVTGTFLRINVDCRVRTPQ